MQQKLPAGEEKFLIWIAVAVPWLLYTLIMAGYLFGWTY